MSERRAVEMRITGRVQGVGFRYFTARAARRLGIVGEVRNLGDGAVEVRAAGDAEALASFRQELARGPTGARVERLDERPLAAPPDWQGFDITFR